MKHATASLLRLYYTTGRFVSETPKPPRVGLMGSCLFLVLLEKGGSESVWRVHRSRCGLQKNMPGETCVCSSPWISKAIFSL
jgi:hypothetical protein